MAAARAGAVGGDWVGEFEPAQGRKLKLIRRCEW
jgi:hypothetical protein